MGLRKLANLENTRILSPFSHVNFHLLLIYWMTMFLFLRISNTEEKERTEDILSLQISIGLEEEGMTPAHKFVEGSSPGWWVKSLRWVKVEDTQKLLRRVPLLSGTHGYKVTQESSCKRSPGETVKWQRRFCKGNCSRPCSWWSKQIFCFLPFRMHSNTSLHSPSAKGDLSVDRAVSLSIDLQGKDNSPLSQHRIFLALRVWGVHEGTSQTRRLK